jgi:hypothetical protein
VGSGRGGTRCAALRLAIYHLLKVCSEQAAAVVEAGDAVLFTRGVVHTFTAPMVDLTLLSYHAPFFEFDDTRQFTIPRMSEGFDYAWQLGRLVSGSENARAGLVGSVA